MIVTTRRCTVLEEHRVPWREASQEERSAVLPCTSQRPLLQAMWWEGSAPGGPLLLFADASDGGPAVPAGEHRLDGVPVFGRLLADDVVRPLLADQPKTWHAERAVLDTRGRPVASLWRADDGSVLLPFDPDEVLWSLLTEEYLGAAGGPRRKALAVLVRQYYRVRPVLPRAVQIALRRLASRLQAKVRFPAWPVEPGLQDLRALLLGLVAEVTPEPLPYLAPWPGDARWAMVLTHDVETGAGHDQVPVLRDLELDLGFRSAWNFVAGSYEVDPRLRRSLEADGFEVGVHGLRHDGLDLTRLAERLPRIQEVARSWGAVGFRFPATHRRCEAVAGLPFEYDSSYPDTDPFEPQPGGCCSLWPYLLGEVVELPITLTQDHTLFVILRQASAAAWLEKVEAVRGAGGMALLITHPDYVDRTPLAACYRELLTSVRDDPQMWHALPREVGSWWRRRAASVPVCRDGRWVVEGPAAGEARVCFASSPCTLKNEGTVRTTAAPRP